MGNQYYLIFEKPLEQNDKINFGFRFDNLFGNDWPVQPRPRALRHGPSRPTTSRGYDPAQFYGEVHLPWSSPRAGIDIKGGRFYTLAGYEVVPATGTAAALGPLHVQLRPAVHPLRDADHPAPHRQNINLYNGADQRLGPLVRHAATSWGYIGGFSWTSKSDKTILAIDLRLRARTSSRASCPPARTRSTRPASIPPPPQFAGQTQPGYHSNDRGLFTTVLTHKWSDKLTQVMETDQAWETNVPFAWATPTGSTATTPSGTASATGSSTQFNDKLTGVWRSEIFRDNNGVRTGFAGQLLRVHPRR